MEAPAHTGEHQPYPVFEQRPPPMGVPDRDRWERSEDLRERREEARDEERRKREAEKGRNTCTGEETIDKARRWARQEADLEEGQPITMATWNCCSLRTANNTIAGQTDLDQVLEDTGAHVMMLQETRVRQAHKKSRPIENASYRTYYSSLPANRTRSGKK
eukprot:7036488-Pyramimonas_sp.AAC.1